MSHEYEATCFQCGVPVGLDQPLDVDIFCSADCQIYYEYRQLVRSNIDLKLKPLRWFTIYKISGRIIAMVRAESEEAAEKVALERNPEYNASDAATWVTKEVEFPMYIQLHVV